MLQYPKRHLFLHDGQTSAAFGLGVNVSTKKEWDQVKERDYKMSDITAMIDTPCLWRKIFLGKHLREINNSSEEKCTKVIGLTIHEIFMTGRNPTLTVALICSNVFAPAKKLVRHNRKCEKYTNYSHRRKIHWKWAQSNACQAIPVFWIGAIYMKSASNEIDVDVQWYCWKGSVGLCASKSFCPGTLFEAPMLILNTNQRNHLNRSNVPWPRGAEIKAYESEKSFV